MKNLRNITILLMFGIITLNGQTRFEIFPLKKNLHYSYDYYQKTYDRVWLFSTLVYLDSGTVDYVVLDSTKSNDTTISWNVLEVKDFYHWEHRVRDTSFYVHDTTKLNLLECTQGFHNIKITGLVWHFPLITPAQEISRYDSARQKEISLNWGAEDQSRSQYVSLKFSDSLGLHYFRTESYFGHIDGGSGTSLATLRASPVAIVANSSNSITGFDLKQNYPNPFNPSTRIDFVLPIASFTTLKIFDPLGREIVALFAQDLGTGQYSQLWDASNYPSGVYFYRLQSGNFVQTKKLLLQK
jgi:hypothetical protein